MTLNAKDINITPTANGYNKSFIWVTVGLIAICLVGASIYVLFIEVPVKQIPSNTNKTLLKTQRVNYSKSAQKSLIDEIVNAPITPIISIAGLGKANTNMSKDMESDLNKNQIIKEENSSEYQKQAQQFIEQQQLKRLQAKYMALSSKANMSVDILKNTSSSVIGQINSTTSKNVSKPPMEEEQNVIIKPISPYVIKAGFIIPSVMISGLNSQISGTVIAQVRENVYDSTTGRFLLIPQGSRLVGTYSNTVQYGEDRIGVAWNTLTFPNGGSISLKGNPGSDLSGYTGFSDSVDNHYLKIFGASFVMGVITGALQYSQNSTNNNAQIGGFQNPTVGQTMAGSLGQQLGQTGMMVAQKGLNIAPTIIIRPGYMFSIMLVADLNLKPYKE